MFSKLTIKDIILLVAIAILIFFLLKDCSGSNNGEDTITVERYTDTVTVTHIDTVEFERIKTITKTIIAYQETTVLPDSSWLRHYSTLIEDSLLSGNIDTYIKQKDTSLFLLDQTITYIPKFPKYIYRTDSVFIKDSIVTTIIKRKMGFLLGTDIAIGEGFGIIPKVGIQVKKGHIGEIGYDLLNKNIVLGFKYRFGK